MIVTSPLFGSSSCHLLSFFGRKWGYGDLRGASKECLLELAVIMKILRMNTSESGNREFWDVEVDANSDLK